MTYLFNTIVNTDKNLEDLPFEVVVMHYLHLLCSEELLIHYIRLIRGRFVFRDYHPNNWPNFIVWASPPIPRDVWVSVYGKWCAQLRRHPVKKELKQQPIDYLIAATDGVFTVDELDKFNKLIEGI